MLHAGHQEANAAVRLLEAEAAAARGHRGGRLKLLPVALHAGMSAASQAAALEPTPRTHRKASLLADSAAAHANCINVPKGRLLADGICTQLDASARQPGILCPQWR